MDGVHGVVGLSFSVDSLAVHTLCSKRLDLKVGGDEFSKGLMIIVDHVWWCKSTSLPMTWCVAWFRMMYTSMKVWSWQVAWYNVQQWQRLVPQDISNINQMGNNKSGACIIIVPYRHNYKWHDMSFGLGMILLFTKAWPWHVTWHGMQVAWCHWLTKVEPHDIWQIQNQQPCVSPMLAQLENFWLDKIMRFCVRFRCLNRIWLYFRLLA